MFGRMDCAPVRQDETPITPVAFKHLVQQPGILAGVIAVDAVIGAHHRSRLAALDPDLEGEEVRFAGVSPVDANVERACARSPGR